MYQKYSCLKCNLKAHVCRLINSYRPNLIALPQCDLFFPVFVALLLFGQHIKRFLSLSLSLSLFLTKLTNERGFYRSRLYSTHVHRFSHHPGPSNRRDIYIPVLIEGARAAPCVSQQSFNCCKQTATPPIPVAAQPKAWVCGRSIAGIEGSNKNGGVDVCVL